MAQQAGVCLLNISPPKFMRFPEEPSVMEVYRIVLIEEYFNVALKSGGR